jgi:hypothetical protein
MKKRPERRQRTQAGNEPSAELALLVEPRRAGMTTTREHLLAWVHAHGLAGPGAGGHPLLDGGGGIPGQQRHLLGHGIARAGLLGQAAEPVRADPGPSRSRAPPSAPQWIAPLRRRSAMPAPMAAERPERRPDRAAVMPGAAPPRTAPGARKPRLTLRPPGRPPAASRGQTRAGSAG